jgi:hypothetical protein
MYFFSALGALEIAFTEREASVEGGSSTLEDEFSEYENHVSFNLYSDSELEQEDEIDPQTAHQLPAGGGIWMVK